MTAAAVLAAIQDDVEAAISGVIAPTYPPESLNEFPASVVFPLTVEAQMESAAFTHLLETWIVQVHLARGSADLAQAAEQCIPYADAIFTQMRNDPTFGGTVETIRNNPEATFGEMSYGATATIGWSFRIETKRTL